MFVCLCNLMPQRYLGRHLHRSAYRHCSELYGVSSRLGTTQLYLHSANSISRTDRPSSTIARRNSTATATSLRTSRSISPRASPPTGYRTMACHNVSAIPDPFIVDERTSPGLAVLGNETVAKALSGYVMAHADHGCLKVGDCVESFEIEGAEEL